VVVNGLKDYAVELSTVISVADSGGSTGRLRDEFGFQPVGDLRQTLASMAVEKDSHYIRDLLLYRFENNKSNLQGHNLGNLILTALQDMSGNTADALQIAQQIFRIKGNIYPVTNTNVELVVEYQDGTVKIGEHILDNKTAKANKIKRVKLSPRAKLYAKASEAIKQADLIIIGPGDYYASLHATLCVDGMKKALQEATGQVVYIMNLMTRFSQTHGLPASAHLQGIEKRIGRRCDFVIVNNGLIPKSILKTYGKDKEYPVIDDLPQSKAVIRQNIINKVPFIKSKSDTVNRSLLRHDQKKLAKILFELI